MVSFGHFLSFLWSHTVKHIYILPRNIIVIRLAKDLNVSTLLYSYPLRLILLQSMTIFNAHLYNYLTPFLSRLLMQSVTCNL